MSIVALIPARGGSKSIPKKNIALCAGQPLLKYTCEAALESGVIDRVILSTDSEEIALVGANCGVEVPFLRPAGLAADDTPSIGVISHALEWLREHGHDPHAILLLQPTSPLRTARHIVEAARLFKERSPDSVVSVVEISHRFHPLSLMKKLEGQLVPYVANCPTVTRRQELSPLYARNGPAILIVKAGVVDAGSLYGNTTLGYVMDAADSIDIDSPFDMEVADFLIRRRRSRGNNGHENK